MQFDDVRKQQISSTLPETIHAITLHEEGVDNLVVEVNARWMCRVPRNAMARQRLQKERKVLAALRDECQSPK